MAKKATKHKKQGGFSEKIRNWIKANQRISMVILLAVISFTFAFPALPQLFSPNRGESVQAEIFGKLLTANELSRLESDREAVTRLLLGGVGRFAAYSFPDLLSGLELVSASSQEQYMYLAEAKRLGLRVSDTELGEVRRRLWRQLAATVRAREEMPPLDPTNPQAARNAQYQMFSKRSDIAKDLEDRNAFDSRDWSEQVQRVTGYDGAVAFEEAVRDVLLAGKLQDYVNAPVNVTAEAVFERYRDRDQKRKLSWIRLEPSDDLEAKVKEKVEQEGLEAYYDANRSTFFLEQSITCDYLFTPWSHFETKVRNEIDEEALLKEYQQTLEDYRRPDIRTDTAEFALLGWAEMMDRDREVYRPLEEVRDEVSETYVAKQTEKELRAYVASLKNQLYPPAGREAKSVAELKKQDDFLVEGHVEPTGQVDAEDSFGEVYAPVVAQWFRTASTTYRLSGAQEIALKSATRLEEKGSAKDEKPKPKGFVFYLDVEILDPHDPPFEEIRGRVTDAAYADKLLELLRGAAEAKIEEVESKVKETEWGASPLADLAAGDVEIEVSEGVKAKAVFGDVEKAHSFVGRQDQLLVAKAADDTDADDSDASETEDEDETEVHVSSAPLRSAAFGLEVDFGLKAENPKKNVTVAVAEDEDEAACYIVSVDDGVYPDPSGFEKRRDSYEAELLQEKRQNHFESWRRDLFQRAYPNAAAPTEVAVGDDQ